MALEFENSLVKISKVLKEDTAQNIVESDIIVPDSKPDVDSILSVDARVRVLSQEVYKDAVVLRGNVNFKILYMSDDPSRLVCSMEHTANFDQTMDAQGVDANMKNYVDSKVEHVDYNVLNGRKVNMKAILNHDIKVVEPAEVAAVSSFTGEGNVQVTTSSLETYHTVEHENVEAVARYEVEIPVGKAAVKEVLKTDAYVKEKDVKVAGGKAVVKGTLQVSSLYVPDMDEKPVEFATNEVPFSEVLDIYGLNDSSDFNLAVSLKDVNVSVKEDDDGDSRVLEYEAVLKFEPSSLEKQIFEVVSDAYGLTSNIELEKSPVRLVSVVGDAKAQTTLRDTAYLAAEAPPVGQVYNTMCRAVVTGVTVERDKVHVDGVVEATIMYMSDQEGRPLGGHVHHMPFHHVMEIRGVTESMKPQVMAEAENCTVDVGNEREFELKVVMNIAARVMNEMFVDVVTKVEEFPLEDRGMAAQPSMVVYYVQNGDTLWNIAKKYLTTINDLMRVNGMENADTLAVGQQLLIPRAS